MENQKKISLGRKIRFILIYVYILIVIGVILIVGITMHSYQNQMKIERKELLTEYSAEISEKIAEMKGIVKQLFVNDRSVKGLQKYINNTDSFDEIITLKDDLRLSYSLSDCLEGLCVYYGYGTNRLYQLDSAVELSVRNSILSTWDVLAKNESQGTNEIILNLDSWHYYIYEMDMGAISVIGMISLDQESDHFWETENCEFGILNVNTNSFESFSVDKSLGRNMEFDTQVPKIEIFDTKYQVYNSEIQGSGLQAVSFYRKNLWSYMNVYHVLVVVLLLCSVYPALSFYRLIKRQLLEPLKMMTDTMLRIQGGHLENFNAGSHIEEIDEVNKSIETMLQEVMNWKNKMYEAQIEIQMAELQYLQLQLRPHFYLNCMKSINGLLMARKYDKIQDYLVRVSSHFQYLMQKSSAFVTLHQELDFTRNYLEMINFNNSLTVRIDDEMGCAKIPILSIQSFVENSVKYAGKNREDLLLRICVERVQTEEGDYISVIVSDNGRGYPENVLKKINSDFDSETTKCIGIGNLKKRLDLIYAKEAITYFENRNGAVSQLLLPFRKENAK